MTIHLSSEQFQAALKNLPLPVQKRYASWGIINADRSVANETMSAAHWDTQTRLREKVSQQQVIVNGYARDFERGNMAPASRFRTDADGPHTTADETSLLDQARGKLAELKDQLNRLIKRGASVPSFPPTPNLVGLLTILASGAKYVEFAPSVTLKKGQRAAEALSAIREVIAEKARELKGIDALPLPEAEALAKAIRDIEKMAVGGAADFSRTLRMTVVSPSPNVPRRHGDIAWPKTYLSGDGPDGLVEIGNGLAFAAWLHRDALIARAKQEISKLAQPDRAMALADRPQRKAELSAEILELERTEEVMLDMAFAEGANVAWRHDASAEAILRIKRAEA